MVRSPAPPPEAKALAQRNPTLRILAALAQAPGVDLATLFREE